MVGAIYGWAFLAIGTGAVAANLSAFSLLPPHIDTVEVAVAVAVAVAEEEQFLCDREKVVGEAGRRMRRGLRS